MVMQNGRIATELQKNYDALVKYRFRSKRGLWKVQPPKPHMSIREDVIAAMITRKLAISPALWERGSDMLPKRSWNF